MTEPGVDDIEIMRGANFEVTYACTDDAGAAIDFSGCAGLAQIREYAGAPDALATLTVTFPIAGSVKAELGWALAEALPTTGRTYRELNAWVWDLFIIQPSLKRYPLMVGMARIMPRTSHL